jgi:hypothetical protein
MAEYLIKGINIWSPELFNKKVIVKLKGYVCDIGTVLGYSIYAKYDSRRALRIKGYSGYCNEYVIDLDDMKFGLDIQVVTEEQFKDYKKLFDNTNNIDESRNVCKSIQNKELDNENKNY